jgi:hypothetical protein
MNEATSQAVADRPTSWWKGALERRAERMHDEYVDLSQPICFESEAERRAAIKFFNAALRAEESGLRQAHELAAEVGAWDADLATVLRLYGLEEGWHRELITRYLEHLGGTVEPMGRTTRLLYGLYARAQRMETIVLLNLMFETIGATTYRLALRRVAYPSARHMLTILTRDESFHVPLNVHFLKRVKARDPRAFRRLRPIFQLTFFGLLLLPWASRPKAQAFDRIQRADLCRAYAEQLGRVFAGEPGLGLAPSRWVLWLFGVRQQDLGTGDVTSTSALAAERAEERSDVEVTAL